MTGAARTWPRYADLAAREDAPAGSAWGLFGPDDQVGTINLLSPETARRGAGLVRRGATFNLDYELNTFRPPVSPYRRPLNHTVVNRHDGQVYDDYITDFYLQGSSQIDGLRHHRHKVHGFYGGVADESIRAAMPALGVQHIAARGIAGRAVLLDVQRYLADQGRPLDIEAGAPIRLADLEGAARTQALRFERGDILLLHTGWAQHFLERLTPREQARLIARRIFCGVEQSREMLAWFWDNGFSVVASDTVAVEVMPAVPESPFDGNVARMMHPDLIALLGLCLGELWKLDTLAADCAADGVYEFMVTAKPLNLVGGVGSPPNALALK